MPDLLNFALMLFILLPCGLIVSCVVLRKYIFASLNKDFGQLWWRLVAGRASRIQNIISTGREIAHIHSAQDDENEINDIVARIEAATCRLLSANASYVLILSKYKNSDNRSFITHEGESIEGIEIDPSKGVCGLTISTGKTINISRRQCNKDVIHIFEDFASVNSNISCVLCVPIFINPTEIIGVILILNKQRISSTISYFSPDDEQLAELLASNAGVAFRRSRSYDYIRRCYRKEAGLLSIVRASSADKSIEQILSVTIAAANDLIQPDRISVYLCDHQKQEAWICVSKDALEGLVVPFGQGVAGTVAQTGKTIRIDNAYEDPRFLSVVDCQTGFRTKSMLCVGVPGFCSESKPIAVIQLINKKNKNRFDEDDEEALTALSNEVSVAMRQKMMEVSLLKVARNLRSSTEPDRYNSAVLEESLLTEYGSVAQRSRYAVVKGSHAAKISISRNTTWFKQRPSSPCSELLSRTPPNKDEEDAMLVIDRWDVDPFELRDSDMMKYAEHMFVSCDLVEAFQIPISALRNFIMAVHAGYNPRNSFHCFRHGWSVLHVSYLILRHGASDYLEPLDVLAVLVAALCHDIDHPGNNNAFEIATRSDLSFLYADDPVLERHHAATTLKLLKEDSNDIIVALTYQEKLEFRRLLASGIMATDMALHFDQVEQLVACSKREPHFDASNRRTLIGHIVHCADLSGQTMKLEIAQKWGNALMLEFAAQSSKEVELGLPVTPFMQGLDSELNKLQLQYGFVSNIVVPLWAALSASFPELESCCHQAHSNKMYYQNEIHFLTSINKPIPTSGT